MHRPFSPHSGLFESVAAALEKSGRLTEDVIGFVDAALFPAAPEALTAFLTDDARESERDSLLDLIFSPDLAVQIALEPVIESACTTAAAIAALRDRLLALPIHAMVSMPDGRRLTSLHVPDYIKSRYLDRLNLAWHLPPRVRAAIDGHVAPDMALTVKVRLRNGHLRPTGDQETILCRFFERMADNDPEYPACLDLCLTLLETAGRAVDWWEHLVAHKRWLFRSLRQAQRFDELLRQSNMETLMLQGLRAPHVSRDDLVRQMRLTDRICAGMYGKTEAIAPLREDPLRIVDDLADSAAAVRTVLDG